MGVFHCVQIWLFSWSCRMFSELESSQTSASTSKCEMALCCCSWMVFWGFISMYNDRFVKPFRQFFHSDVILEARRKDTNVMICHHIATIFLITFSLGMRFWQIGCLVLFCHDICDIFLDASKIFVYIQNRPGASNSTKIICEVVKTLGFVCFVLSWILFRFHFYPRKALYSVMYHRWAKTSVKP